MEMLFRAAGLALVLGLALPLLAVGPAGAASGGCSSDTFTVDGTTLVAEVCGPTGAPVAKGGKAVAVTVNATFSVKGQAPVARKITFDLLSADESAHAIDDVPLGSLGIAKTLHITIGYKAGTARLEHALLIPGAIPLK